MLLALACSDDESTERPAPEPAAPLSAPLRLCRGSASLVDCRPVPEVEAWLNRPDLEILGSAAPPAGIQGARVLTLRAPRLIPVVFRAKWRAHSTTTRRNSPRRELAAYAVQKLFLTPDRYVVPPTAAHCFPLAAYRARVDPKASATFPQADCVYGILSYWLEDVESLEDAREAGWFHGQHQHALDPSLFAENAGYRDSIAHVNLLTFTIGHADSHARNFVITRDATNPIVYSVDNSLSLGLEKNKNLDRKHDWSQLKVPELPRAAIARLRGADLDYLRSITELEPRSGRLVVVAPKNRTPSADGIDWVDGRLRVGLTEREIDDLRVRIEVLLERVDRGEIHLY